MTKRIVIIGAGPTGLGAGTRLHQLGYSNWRIYEREMEPGGLGRSFTTQRGFTWDIGGHVIFSHYKPFDAFLESTLGDETVEHERECWIRMFEKWIPYPFQNNIRHLPSDAALECLMGLAEVYGGKPDTENFETWIQSVFGAGIAKHFMMPYNFKVWATPPKLMDAGWIAERVAVVNLEKVLRNVVEQKDEVSWGPNAKFSFPLHGGTGEIYRRGARPLAEHIRYGTDVVAIDTSKKTLRLADGQVDTYDVLINTMPLDLLVRRIEPAQPRLHEAAEDLELSGGYIVGIGLDRPMPTSKCWTYYPEENCPFYRVTFFHNYSPNNVPDGDVGRYSALMAETSYSAHKPESKDAIVEQTIQGCINAGLIEEADRAKVVETWLFDIDYSYPIPSLRRDTGLRVLQPALEELDVLSRGRFGAWRYEVGNMDHSFMMGWEAVERVLNDGKETVFNSKG